MSTTLPKLVLALTHNHDAWIVGSAASPNAIDPRDYDVIVPHYEWGKAAHLIPPQAVLNSFGGWKCRVPVPRYVDGKIDSYAAHYVEVDVWPGDLGWLLQRPKCKFAWHPASGTRIQKI